jgi:hypothetical protein
MGSKEKPTPDGYLFVRVVKKGKTHHSMRTRKTRNFKIGKWKENQPKTIKMDQRLSSSTCPSLFGSSQEATKWLAILLVGFQILYLLISAILTTAVIEKRAIAQS